MLTLLIKIPSKRCTGTFDTVTWLSLNPFLCLLNKYTTKRVIENVTVKQIVLFSRLIVIGALRSKCETDGFFG